MITNSTKAVTTAGSRVPLAATRTIAYWVFIQSLNGNTGKIYFGGSTVSSSSGGTLQAAGDGFLFPPRSNIPGYDLSQIYIDAAVSGEGVGIVYDAA